MLDEALNNQAHDGTLRDALRYYGRRVKRRPVYRTWRQSVRNVKTFVPEMWRRATYEFRALPSVVIVGAMKAGTTQLFAYLIRHPRLFASCNKELDYFSRYSDRSLQWYRSRFPIQRKVRAVNGHAMEASPSYISTPSALPKMRSLLPDAKIIVLLRDPVSRAFSHYQHVKTRHVEQRSFQQVVEEDLRESVFPARLGAALKADAPIFKSCVNRGYYALQLELLLTLYPRERVLILDSADLFADTNATCQRVFDFVGVETFDVQPGKVYNRGYYNEKIDPHVAELLREHYRPYDELLTQLVGHSFGWMKRGKPMAA